jgi:hypothetical protein
LKLSYAQSHNRKMTQTRSARDYKRLLQGFANTLVLLPFQRQALTSADGDTIKLLAREENAITVKIDDMVVILAPTRENIPNATFVIIDPILYQQLDKACAHVERAFPRAARHSRGEGPNKGPSGFYLN